MSKGISNTVLQPGSRNNIRGIKLPRFQLFKAVYTPQYEPTLVRKPWTYGYELAMARSDAVDEHREKRGLWLKITNRSYAKPIIHSKVKQWCRDAWYRALKDRGFDRAGIAVSGGDASNARQLRGTLKIDAWVPNVLDVPRSRIQGEMNTLADSLVAYNFDGKNEERNGGIWRKSLPKR